ncbi:hypothetical protein AAFC00_002250 [Neodothiora populina]|uniref:Uncharacterized protein n=1 Tax=Neodothiora populina TaxID=2781224 RepID=A0ABR3PGT5_9PEZI
MLNKLVSQSVRQAATTSSPRIYKASASILAQSRAFSSSQVRRESKTAIVTGSSRGIGKAIALRLARDGYDLCITDVQANQKGIDEVVAEVKDLGRNAVGIVGDVTDYAQVEEVVKTSVSELGPLNTMVANAGIAQVKPLLSLTTADFERMFAINVVGVHNSYSAAARQLISQGTTSAEKPGRLIAAASIAGFKPFPMLSHYSASKFAVRGLNQAYAVEMAEHNILCNCYAPGIVGTAMWDLIDEEIGKQRGEKLGELVKKGDMMKKFVDQMIALGRVSVPEDVAKLVSFLASDDATYVTGQCMVVDGGIHFS